MAFSLQLPGLTLPIKADATAYNKVMEKLPKTAEEAAKKINVATRRIGRQLTLALTVPLAAIGASSIKAFSNFDKAMTNTSAIMGGLSRDVRAEMEDVARTISTQTTFAANELAEAFVTIARTGANAENAINTIGVAAKFAQANMLGLKTSTILLTDSLAALGLKARDPEKRLKNMTRLANLLSLAAIKSQGSANDFAVSLTRKAGPAIRASNIGLEQGISLLSVYADQGVRGALAGERTEIVLRELARAQLRSTRLWDKVGISASTATGEYLPLSNIIGQLEDKLGKLGPFIVRATLQTLGFQQRAIQATLALLGTSKELARYTKLYEEHAAVLDSLIKIQMQSFSARLTVMRNKILLAQQAMGQVLAPTILLITSIIVKATDAFRALPIPLQFIVAALVSVIALAGPIILMFGQLVFFGAQLGIAFKKIRDRTVESTAALKLSTSALVVEAAAAQKAADANLVLAASKTKVQAASSKPPVVRTTSGKFASASKLIEQGGNLQRISAAGQKQFPFFASERKGLLGYGKAVDKVRSSLGPYIVIQGKSTKSLADNAAALSRQSAALGDLQKKYPKLFENMRAMNSQLSKTSKILDETGQNIQKSTKLPVIDSGQSKKQIQGATKQLSLFDKQGQLTATSLQRLNLELAKQNQVLPLNLRQWDTGVAAYKNVVVSQLSIDAATKQSTKSMWQNTIAGRINTVAKKAMATANRAVTSTLVGLKIAANKASVAVGFLLKPILLLAAAFVALQVILDVIDAVRSFFQGGDSEVSKQKEKNDLVAEQLALMQKIAQINTQQNITDIGRIKNIGKQTDELNKFKELQEDVIKDQKIAASKLKDQLKSQFSTGTRLGRGLDVIGSATFGVSTNKEKLEGQLKAIQADIEIGKASVDQYELAIRNIKNELETINLQKLDKADRIIKNLEQKFQLLNPTLTETQKELLKVKFAMQDLDADKIPGLKKIRDLMERGVFAKRKSEFANTMRQAREQIELTNPQLSKTQAAMQAIVLKVRELRRIGFPHQEAQLFGDALKKALQNKTVRDFQDTIIRLQADVLLFGRSAGESRDALSDAFKVLKFGDKLEALNFTQKQINDKTWEYAKALKAVRNAKAFDVLRTSANRLVEDLKKPEQKFKDQLKLLIQMRRAGLLTSSQFQAGIKKEQEILASGKKKNEKEKGIFEPKFAGAVEAGSVEAFTAINKALSGRQTDQARQLAEQKKQSSLTKMTNAVLVDIRSELKGKAVPSVAAGVPK